MAVKTLVIKLHFYRLELSFSTFVKLAHIYANITIFKEYIFFKYVRKMI